MNEIFRTPVNISPSPFHLELKDYFMFLGSCFSDNIGKKLADLHFHVKVNPFGTLFNPFSIAQNLTLLLNEKIFSPEDLHFYNEKWFSFNHNTEFSSHDKNICLSNINIQLQQASTFLKKTGCLIITFGTAWIYEWKENGQIVANCHKLPPINFNRKLLTINDIVTTWQLILKRLSNEIPGLKIIFTLSPIRHLKDGAEQNLISKSILRLAINELLNYPNTYYFPAYEIVMDELRDYRFYDEDMIHLNTTAKKYIFTKFIDNCFDEETKKILPQLENLTLAKNHKIQSIHSSKEFLQSSLKLALNLQQQYPILNFKETIEYFQNEISKQPI